MQSTSEAEIASLGRKILESGEDIGLLHLIPLPHPTISNSDLHETATSNTSVRESKLLEIQSQPQPTYLQHLQPSFSLQYNTMQIK